MLFWELDFDSMNTLYKLVNVHNLKIMHALISNSKLASKLHADTSPSTPQPPLLIHPRVLKSIIICYSRISLIKSSFIDSSLPSLSLPTTYSWISLPTLYFRKKYRCTLLVFSFLLQYISSNLYSLLSRYYCKKCNACRSPMINMDSK